jgi:hypothetical protein
MVSAQQCLYRLYPEVSDCRPFGIKRETQTVSASNKKFPLILQYSFNLLRFNELRFFVQTEIKGIVFSGRGWYMPSG